MLNLPDTVMVGATPAAGQGSGPCECEKDGHCPRYNRWIGGRLRQICRGEAPGLDAATCQQYRDTWAAQAAGLPPPAPATAKPCPHLGRRARDAEGKVKKVICQAPG